MCPVLVGNERTVRKTSVRLLALKAGRTWEELFATLPDFTGERVYPGDPYELLPMIRQGIDMELGTDGRPLAGP